MSGRALTALLDHQGSGDGWGVPVPVELRDQPAGVVVDRDAEQTQHTGEGTSRRTRREGPPPTEFYELRDSLIGADAWFESLQENQSWQKA